MLAILIHLLIICIVLGLLWWLISSLPIPAPFALAVRIIFIIICILVVLGICGPYLGLGHYY